MDAISSKGFQKWESGLHPTLLSCLFSVKPQAGQAAYLFQAWSLETIACNLNLRGCGGLKLTVGLL
jgi:hypothetical protein